MKKIDVKVMFCDWNLLLNEKDGSNHVGNYCDAPIMADTKNDKIYIHDSYYYSSKWSSEIDTASFKNPDGTSVSVVPNATDNAKYFILRIKGKVIKTNIEPNAIPTYIFTVCFR